MAKVAIVENVKTIREGLQTLINASEGFNCIGAYSNYESFINDSDNISPDVILIDLHLPKLSGLEGIKKLKELSDQFAIIVLTVYEENERIFDAISVGAVGYLVKNTPPDKMIQIIKDASEGRVLMNSYIARKALNYFKSSNTANNLNPVELKILKKFVEGHSLKAIENSIAVDIADIKSHFKEIYNKLHNSILIKT